MDDTSVTSGKNGRERFYDGITPVLFLLIWSGGALFSKLGLQYSDVWSFLFLRASLALIFLGSWFFARKEYRNLGTSLNKGEILRILLAGLLLQVLYLVFYFLAIKSQLSLGLIILIFGVQPILTKLVSTRRFSATDMALLGACFIGLAISTLGYHRIEQFSLMGIVMAVLGLISITAGTIAQSRITANPGFALLMQTILAFIIFAAITAANGFHFTPNVSSVLALIWMGAVVSVGAFLLLMRMLRRSSADKVSTLFFLLPLLTMILESVSFKNHLNIMTITGVLIVCVSLYIYQFRPFKKAQQPQEK